MQNVPAINSHQFINNNIDYYVISSFFSIYQEFKSGKFCMYDYGESGNWIKYGMVIFVFKTVAINLLIVTLIASIY